MSNLVTQWRRLSSLLILASLLCVSTASAQLSGSYTIGSGGNYASFTAAISALTTSGVSGAVTFNVLSGTYNETFTIPAITGASSTNTITFDGGAGNAASRVITYNMATSYGSVITLDGADYVKFKNLTINSTNSSYGYGFLFTNSADYNEISNCVINLPANTTSAYHIGICASTTTSYSTTGDYGNYNLIKDNTITSGYYAIRWNGSGTSSDYTTVTGNQFIGNNVYDWYYYGMYLYYIGGALVVKDNNAVQRTTGTFTTSSGYAYYIYYPNNGPEISYNYAYARYAPYYIYYPNGYYASSTNRGKIFNNMGVGEGTSTIYGLYVNYARYCDILYNSISTKNTTGTAYGIYQYGESTSYDCKILNNIISHDGSGSWYPVYTYYPTSISAYDYNLYYKTGTASENWYWNATTYASFTAMKTAVTTRHQNSKWGNPRFASATDLHSTSLTGYQAGTPVSGYTDDYDNDTRSSTVPCIGADEYLLTNMAYSSATTAQNNTNPASSGIPNQEVIGIQIVVTGSLNALNATSFALNTTGTTNTADITAAKIYYTGSSPVFATTTLVGSYASPSGSFTITGSQALDGPGTNYFWLTYDISASAASGNYIDAQCTGVTVAGTTYTPSTTNPSGNRMILAPLSGIYTIDPNGSGSTNFTSFTNAVNRLIQIGVNGPVTFNVAAATYNEQIIIPPILGASATNTITFDGGTGNAATRILSYNTSLTYDATWTFNGADYITLKNLTVRTTNATYGIAVQLAPGTDALGANYNKILNCNLECPVNT
ncbi:MAG TPA: BNR-repeat neuraminidase N-terminal domain-containing protein, partial [Bacteroidota bacterium]|nr:BNR-repeat neuraminidase N-terminal domain-containing protein [Bacteroidota bacterium]